MTSSWLVFVYKVPPEPAAGRVGLWRKLKALGAVYLQNGVCVLHQRGDILRRLKLLENDAARLGGEATLLTAVPFDDAQERKILARVRADRDEHYREFIGKCDAFEAEIAKEFRVEKFTYAELQEEDADIRKLRRWFDQIRKLDHHGASLAGEAAARLKACEEALDRYAQRVYAEQVGHD